MTQKSTLVISSEDDDSIGTAVGVIQRGGLVAFPTDTVYGLGASVHNDEALEAIYEVKQRSHDKPLPVLISTLEQMTDLTGKLKRQVWQLVEEFWPGPLTLVLPGAEGVTKLLIKDGSIGLRMPNHPFALRLLEESGPLGVTSANLTGEPSPQQAEIVHQALAGKIDLIVDGGITPGGIPSTVLRLLDADQEIIREGPIGVDQIRHVIDRGEPF